LASFNLSDRQTKAISILRYALVHRAVKTLDFRPKQVTACEINRSHSVLNLTNIVGGVVVRNRETST